jgi:hypothetical protein
MRGSRLLVRPGEPHDRQRQRDCRLGDEAGALDHCLAEGLLAHPRLAARRRGVALVADALARPGTVGTIALAECDRRAGVIGSQPRRWVHATAAVSRRGCSPPLRARRLPSWTRASLRSRSGERSKQACCHLHRRPLLGLTKRHAGATRGRAPTAVGLWSAGRIQRCHARTETDAASPKQRRPRPRRPLPLALGMQHVRVLGCRAAMAASIW